MTSANIYSKSEQESLQRLRNVIIDSGNELLLSSSKEMTDENLIMFLRCRNYDIPSSFEKVSKMVKARRETYPDVFDNFYPSALYKVLDTRVATVFKNRDAHGRHIIFLKSSYWDPDVFNGEEMIRSVMMIGFETLQCKETQLNGLVLFYDIAGFTIKHAKHIHPVIIQKYANIILNASPLKIKEVHILNAPMFFNMTLSLVKMFLPQKLRKRIYAHGSSMESLHKWISPEILPEYFGGTLTEEEALDHKILDNLYTPEKEDYYKSFII